LASLLQANTYILAAGKTTSMMEKVYLFKKTGNFTLGIEKVGKKTESGKIKIYDADSKLTKFSVVCKNDLLCKGKVLYPNGDIYNGYLENRKRHGHGTM